MNMEFLTRNYINTTTMIIPSSGSNSTQYLFDRKETSKWTGSNGGTESIIISLSSLTVSRIAIEGCNWAEFYINYYLPSGTSVTFSIQNADTSTLSYSNNAAEDLYFIIGSVTVNTITVGINSQFPGDIECECVQIWINDKLHQLERNPSVNNYVTKKERKEYIHELSDGGKTQFVMSNDYFESTLKLDYVSLTETTYLKDVYEYDDGFVFVPFPTGTNWDKYIYECIWSGGWTFEQFTDNNKSVGYVGQIKLQETGK